MAQKQKLIKTPAIPLTENFKNKLKSSIIKEKNPK